MDSATYQRRRNALSRGEREWRAEADALVTRAASGKVYRLPWRDVASMRLCAAPSRRKPWRYVFEVKSRHGRKLSVDNSHFVSLGQFEDRSDSYCSFVRTALARYGEARPNARVLIGETPTHYFVLLLVALLGLMAGAAALILLPTPLDALPYAAPAKLLLILLMLPLFARWALKGIPRGVPVGEVPERALPPEMPEKT